MANRGYKPRPTRRSRGGKAAEAASKTAPHQSRATKNGHTPPTAHHGQGNLPGVKLPRGARNGAPRWIVGGFLWNPRFTKAF